jgi:hypothetical protein
VQIAFLSVSLKETQPMILAAIFKTTDPAERSTLIVSGSRDHIALNVPPGGCWRELPAGCVSAEDTPVLGEWEQTRAQPASS